ncbi:laminin subunit alpha-1-like [Limulus polyphemus]|uniref:Laminin subunit alpha-1-like n=1 Tax=Limulus polyphemus TaxID=6850 RepID=A0ABM1C2N2_LIMPO|nr:laminin subunit alpha-1-like [Limulus polyphemus]
MAVHSSYDFMLLQMVEGKVMFSVENGAGIISVTFEPLNGNSYWLCDGYWHNIQAVKTKNVVTLSIDGHSSTPGIGQAGVSSTDTKDPLYVGGVPDPTGLRGMNTMQNFVGCMRYVELNGVIQKLVDGRAFGNVTLNSCPTI